MGHMGEMFLRGISTIMVMDHKVMDQEGILMGIPQIIFLGTFCVIYAILGTVSTSYHFTTWSIYSLEVPQHVS